MATFGNTSFSGLNWTYRNADTRTGDKYELTERGSVEKISAGVVITPGSGYMRAVIYGSDQVLIAATEEVEVGAAKSVWDFPLTTAVVLEPGEYWLMVHSGSLYYVLDKSSDGRGASVADTYSDGPADPAGITGADDKAFHIYATYTPKPQPTKYMWWPKL